MTALLYKWTLERYHQAIEAGVFDEDVELINGDLFAMPPEGPEHADDCETVARYLEQQFGAGWQSRQGKPITIAGSEPQPDIAIVRQQSYRQRHPIAEEIALIVEFAYSTQVKDTGVKRDLYATAGIAHYLVADLKSRKLTHYSDPSNGRYRSENTVQSGWIDIGDMPIEVSRFLA